MAGEAGGIMATCSAQDLVRDWFLQVNTVQTCKSGERQWHMCAKGLLCTFSLVKIGLTFLFFKFRFLFCFLPFSFVSMPYYNLTLVLFDGKEGFYINLG
ncbi:hypothetical protein BDZ91DRAFT_146527 [Kalaharituber pfeilii]|nr:hypothetical protein BDZ91DRAFT_146527 [Kalaharituber pfeilii]